MDVSPGIAPFLPTRTKAQPTIFASSLLFIRVRLVWPRRSRSLFFPSRIKFGPNVIISKRSTAGRTAWGRRGRQGMLYLIF